MAQTKNITITVLSNNETFVLHTYVREYRNLMMLIKDTISPEGFGECAGMGRCGTCLVQVNSTHVIPLSGGNEAANLVKHQVTDHRIRLSCQFMPEESINNLIVSI